jgi:hypothetical protein
MNDPNSPPAAPALRLHVPPEGPAVPPGRRLFYADAGGRPCGPSDAVWWCWEGGERWYRVREHPPPGLRPQGAAAGAAMEPPRRPSA